MKVREEIEKYAAESDKPVLLWLLDRYHMESEWKFVARCALGAIDKYGMLNFQANRVWAPTPAGSTLFSAAHPPMPSVFSWPENQECLGCRHSFWRLGENFTQISMCGLGVTALTGDCADRDPDDESE
jgi:hypothetical protein